MRKRRVLMLSKNMFNILHHYSKYVAIVSGACDKILRRKIKLIGAVEAVSNGVFELCDFMSESNYLNSFDNLKILGSETIDLLTLLQDGLNKKFIKITNNFTYYEYFLINKKILASINSYRNEIQELFCNKLETNDIMNELSELFWKQYSNNVIIGLNKSKSRYDDDLNLFARKDDLSGFEDFKSKEFYEANDYIKKFYDNNKNRAIIFYGNPGVGKSTVIKQIAKDLNAKTIRISMDSFKDFDMEKMFSLIDILKPEVLIIDDFDKIEMTPSMLPIFENLHRQIKLTMISVNNLNYFEDNIGLIRPERFDKFIKVERLDDIIIEKIIGKDYMHLIEKIKDWPAAYIRELKENIDVLGADIIDKYVAELQERIEFQNKERPRKRAPNKEED